MAAKCACNPDHICDPCIAALGVTPVTAQVHADAIDRWVAFMSLEFHPMLGKSWAKCRNSDIELCTDFMRANKHLGKGDFELAVNRMFLDKGDSKPKNWTRITELLLCANSSLEA